MGETKQIRVGIYSPYLDIFGGGERYLLNIASSLSKSHEVFIFASPSLKQKIYSLLKIDVNGVHFLSESVVRTKNVFKKYLSLNSYDVFIFMTDGSLPFPVAKKNFLIIQSPVHAPKLTFINYIKLFRWNIICYSTFMQRIIKNKLHKDAKILSPSIDIAQFASNNIAKKNIILSVGRFFSYPHNKKHDVLIDVFKKNYNRYFQGWRLIIAGGLTEVGGKKVFEDLKGKIGTYPIEIISNISFDKLAQLYKEAKIYWHAAGYGEDVQRYPERAEHFGITTLEAMAAGEVPLVFAAGGQLDIITDGYNGYLWNTQEELIKKTYSVIRDEELFKRISQSAIFSAKEYSNKNFYGELEKIIA
jgi:glycosyltransferase involved in cell wall biosynthesis